MGMTTEEKVKAKLDKWVVPGVPPHRHWHNRGARENYLLSISDLDRALTTRFGQWIQVWLETDTLELVCAGGHNPALSPVPDNFEEVQNWVRMIDNLTQG